MLKQRIYKYYYVLLYVMMMSYIMFWSLEMHLIHHETMPRSRCLAARLSTEPSPMQKRRVPSPLASNSRPAAVRVKRTSTSHHFDRSMV